jgi:hypothetical protein
MAQYAPGCGSNREKQLRADSISFHWPGPYQTPTQRRLMAAHCGLSEDIPSESDTLGGPGSSSRHIPELTDEDWDIAKRKEQAMLTLLEEEEQAGWW